MNQQMNIRKDERIIMTNVLREGVHFYLFSVKAKVSLSCRGEWCNSTVHLTIYLYNGGTP